MNSRSSKKRAIQWTFSPAVKRRTHDKLSISVADDGNKENVAMVIKSPQVKISMTLSETLTHPETFIEN